MFFVHITTLIIASHFNPSYILIYVILLHLHPLLPPHTSTQCLPLSEVTVLQARRPSARVSVDMKAFTVSRG